MLYEYPLQGHYIQYYNNVSLSYRKPILVNKLLYFS